jgi:hypothetical protein
MKIHGKITIGNKEYNKGDDVPWSSVYPFFIFHMLAFGLSGFYMAYFMPVEIGQYIFGGLAIIIYLIFYLSIFGLDDVKWMFINSFLGFVGIYTQMGWILEYFGKNIDNYSFSIHIIPFFYFVLYTFLLRQAFLDLTNTRDTQEQGKVDFTYVVVLLGSYLLSYFLR